MAGFCSPPAAGHGFAAITGVGIQVWVEIDLGSKSIKTKIKRVGVKPAKKPGKTLLFLKVLPPAFVNYFLYTKKSTMPGGLLILVCS